MPVSVSEGEFVFFVVLDSTALTSDYFLRSPRALRLRDLAVEGRCRVFIPDVVMAEVERNFKRELQAARDRARDLFGVKFGDLALPPMSEIATAVDEAQARYPESLQSLLSLPGFSTLTFTNVTVERLLQRDLSSRRPFRLVGENKKHSAGMRDAIIWESVLGLTEALGDDDALVLVTDNSTDFADPRTGAINADLADDLTAHGLDPDRFHRYPGVGEFLEQHFPVTQLAIDDGDPMARELPEASVAPTRAVLRGLTMDTDARARLLDAISRTAATELHDVDLLDIDPKTGHRRYGVWVPEEFGMAEVYAVHGPFDVEIASLEDSGDQAWHLDVGCRLDVEFVGTPIEQMDAMLDPASRRSTPQVQGFGQHAAMTVSATLAGTVAYTNTGVEFDLTVTTVEDPNF